MPVRVGSVIGNETKSSLANPLEVELSLDGEAAHDDQDGLFGAHDADSLRIRKGDEVLREGILEKRIVGKEISWAPRYVSLTKDALLFTVNPGGEVRDSVKLLDIARCGDTHSNDHTLFLNGKEKADRGLKKSTSAAALSKTRSFVGSFTSARQETEEQTKVASEWDHSLEIHTERYGRTYYLRAETEEEKDEWEQAINQAYKGAVEKRKHDLQLSLRRRFKLRMRRVVNSKLCQNCISLLLVINFALNVYDSETTYADGTKTRALLDNVDSAFTVIYFLELMVNMYVHWFRSFFTNSWFIFDFIVVMFSVIESIVILVHEEGAGGLAVIRMIRIFRIVRVFNKLKSLQKVILGISSTLLPMSNIVIVFGIINSIYAILATRMYMDSYPEKFGSFVSSSFTMFQVATGDSWVTDIVITLSRDVNNNKTLVLFFFSTYVVVVGIILFNIIVAVLLEGFLGAIQQQEREEAAKEEKEAMQRAAGALDPLLATLAHFQSPQHLESEIQLLFRLLDVDDSGSLSFHEMQQGLESLPLKPPVVMSIEDWESLTKNGTVLDEDSSLTSDAFMTAIRWQLMIYGQRLLGQRMRQCIKTKTEDPIQLFAMKLCLMQVCSPSVHLDNGGEIFVENGANASTQNTVPVHMAQEEQDSEQGVHAKLDKILQLVHESSERSKSAMQSAEEARKTSNAILEHLEKSRCEHAGGGGLTLKNHPTEYSARKEATSPSKWISGNRDGTKNLPQTTVTNEIFVQQAANSVRLGHSSEMGSQRIPSREGEDDARGRNESSLFPIQGRHFLSPVLMGTGHTASGMRESKQLQSVRGDDTVRGILLGANLPMMSELSADRLNDAGLAAME